jgi:16S rRNA (uracil1498-N3)-methyltransferase
MRRFYASPSQFTQDQIELNLDESRHLRDVLRLGIGDEVSVFDGEGREYRSSVTETGHGKHIAKLKVLEEIKPAAPESKLDLTLAIALLKGEKFDLVIQKATELGVSRIIPLLTARADIKIKTGDVDKKLERWRRVALEAVKQCGRAKIPEIAEPALLAEFLGDADEIKLFFSERGGADLKGFLFGKPKAEKLIAIVGPEGGWEESEIDLAREAECHIITLGGRILRAETAGIVVTALLQNLFGDLQ